MSFQHALMHLYPAVIAFAFLVINPALTFLLLRRAGVRGALLGLALVSPVSMVLGGLVFPLIMETMVDQAMNDDLSAPLWVLFNLVPPRQLHRGPDRAKYLSASWLHRTACHTGHAKMACSQ